MNVTLTPEFEAIVRERLQSGRYHDPTEVVENALRLFDDHERLLRLRAEVAVGSGQLDRGEGVPYTSETMERLKRESAANARAGKPIKDVVQPRSAFLLRRLDPGVETPGYADEAYPRLRTVG